MGQETGCKRVGHLSGGISQLFSPNQLVFFCPTIDAIPVAPPPPRGSAARPPIRMVATWLFVPPSPGRRQGWIRLGGEGGEKRLSHSKPSNGRGYADLIAIL